MYEKFGQFIDGKWQKSEKGDSYDVKMEDLRKKYLNANNIK